MTLSTRDTIAGVRYLLKSHHLPVDTAIAIMISNATARIIPMAMKPMSSAMHM